MLVATQGMHICEGTARLGLIMDSQVVACFVWRLVTLENIDDISLSLHNCCKHSKLLVVGIYRHAEQDRDGFEERTAITEIFVRSPSKFVRGATQPHVFLLPSFPP